ncbi:hypothetical protein [Thalassotalea sediminis]|uniref:hypothetical protein n=1 Tax=Thalassotalea sediminis TaxID=1759089 RepID=UPI002572521E|nr:hypothetical protein [Thalassotalea sediminis]
MSALAQNNTTQQTHENSVTSISSVARVDYILRFSKHAVIVVDEDATCYSAVGSQYLANLSNLYNAAYLTMSPRLDDVQVRCRIIEQLFGNVLFDPEQSVAVSLINLIKQHKQPVSIVVENAHHLSFQLLHELCQLAEIAKKASLAVQVVLLALPVVGQKLIEHPILFAKKLSIVDAKSGQLIPLSDKQFNPSRSWGEFTQFKKLVLAISLLAFASALVVYQLYQVDTFNFSKLQASAVEKKGPLDIGSTTALANSNSQPIQPVQNNDRKSKADTSEQATRVLASANEIAALLLASGNHAEPKIVAANKEDASKVIQTPPLKATAADVYSALQPVKVNTEPVQIGSANASKEQSSPLTAKISTTVTPVNYYKNKQGVVLQLAVIQQPETQQAFIESVKGVDVYHYKRASKQKDVTVFTSKIFASREAALAWLGNAAKVIQQREPFIKSVQSINDEIDSYQRSQS